MPIALRIEQKPVTKTEQNIIAMMKSLQSACRTSGAMQICELSRALADEVDHAFTYPDIWGEKRVEDVVGLLEAAAKATKGTPYGENCAARPQDFRSRLKKLLEARSAMDKVREVQEAGLKHNTSQSRQDFRPINGL